MHTSNDVTVTKFLEKIHSNLDNAKFLAQSNGDMAVSKYLQQAMDDIAVTKYLEKLHFNLEQGQDIKTNKAENPLYSQN